MIESAVIDLRDWRNPMPAAARLTLLSTAPPGPDVVEALAELDAETLGEFEQVLLLQAIERQRHWLDALQQPVLAAVAGERDDHDWGREEVAAALTLSKLTAGRRVGAARMLAGPLTRTLDALRAGQISYWHAAHLAAETEGLAVDVALEVESLALPSAIGRDGCPGEGLAAFRRTVTRALLEADVEQIEKNRKGFRSDRRVEMWPTPGGTATITAEGINADVAARIMATLRARADKVGADDTRTVEQRMADAFGDVFDDALTSMNGGKKAKAITSLVLDFATFAGLAEHPGYLDGYGWIPAELARLIAADSEFRRLLTDPLTGHLLDATPRTYRPSKAMRDYLVDRSRVCDHPNCNRPASSCDIDHTVRFVDGGPTTRANTGPGCGRDHPLRHEGGWKLAREPDGTASWTSPAGHTYRKPPWDYRPLK